MGARILVVEDNDDNLRLIEYLLKAGGHEILVAKAGGDGVEMARTQSPELILMDIQLPDMDGHEALSEIREQAGSDGPPVVAVTAFAMVGDREQVMSSGFDGYIPKPIEPRTFTEQVEAFL